MGFFDKVDSVKQKLEQQNAVLKEKLEQQESVTALKEKFEQKNAQLKGKIEETKVATYEKLNYTPPTEEEKENTEPFLVYSELDNLGRAGVAYANLCCDMFNEGTRKGDLSQITPSGWHQVLTEAPPSVPWPAFTPTIMPFRFFFA